MQTLHAPNHTTYFFFNDATSFFFSRNLSTKKSHSTSSQENHATSAQKNQRTSPTKKACNHHKQKQKITQPLHTLNHANSHQKESRSLSAKKIMQPLHISECKKACKLRKITQRLHTQKSCNLSTHKITQSLNKKYHATSPPKKHRKNRKTLP